MGIVVKWSFAVAVLFFSIMMLRLTIPYLSFNPYVDFLTTKQLVYHILHWRWAFYLHITTSIFVLFAGSVQFFRKLAYSFPHFHRTIGKMYVLLILLVSGPSGFIMALYANGGAPAQISFAVLSALWIYFTFLAYYFIRKKNIKQHTYFMVRSYALTFSAITLRLFVYFIDKYIHLDALQTYIFVAWASWLVNLAIAEILIQSGAIKWKPEKRKID